MSAFVQVAMDKGHIANLRKFIDAIRVQPEVLENSPSPARRGAADRSPTCALCGALQATLATPLGLIAISPCVEAHRLRLDSRLIGMCPNPDRGGRG